MTAIPKGKGIEGEYLYLHAYHLFSITLTDSQERRPRVYTVHHFHLKLLHQYFYWQLQDLVKDTSWIHT